MSANNYADIGADIAGSLDALNRPRRVPVSVGAAESLHLDDAGGYSGPWVPDDVPYMLEPMDMLASRHHSAVCFVGPARSGKTAALILGWIAHAMTNDIGRMLVMHMTQEKADLFSKLDIDTSIDASPKLRALKSPSQHDDTIRLKIFRHGMAIRLAWPSRSEMAGTTYRYVALTDYDRYTEQRGMGGSIFDSASKRTQTLMSRGMVLVESSPERKIIDPKWRPASPHEAPPCGGSLGVYNRSDRRRYYWPCPHCGDHFEASPGLGLFADLPDLDTLRTMVRTLDIRQFAADHAHITCPHCGCSDIDQSHKHAMNTAGRWVADRQTINADGVLSGPAPTASIAGYWLGGVAAAYQPWQSLLENYLQGVRELELTGKEETLEAKTYVDQAMPYAPEALRKAGRSEHIDSRAEDYPHGIVPEGVRCLFSLVDVQARSFEVSVIGHGVDNERWLIDRISLSEADDGTRLQPPVYAEHWAVLRDRIIASAYELPDGRFMRVHYTLIDSGGYHNKRSKAKADSTKRAYEFWRQLKRERLSHRVRLVKGTGSLTAPLQRETFPDASKRNDRHAGSRGDVPVLILNVDKLKDMVFNDLQRDTPGPGFVHLPAWLDSAYRDELTAEQKGDDGRWHTIGRRRNETWDHFSYDMALWVNRGGDKIIWERPPAWCAEWDRNSEVISEDQRKMLQSRGSAPRKRRNQQQPKGIAPDGWGF